MSRCARSVRSGGFAGSGEPVNTRVVKKFEINTPVTIPIKKMAKTKNFALMERAIIVPPLRSIAPEQQACLEPPCRCRESFQQGSVPVPGTIPPFRFAVVEEQKKRCP